MPVSKDLMLAVLSMDAYNRGYGAGLADGGADDVDGLDESGFIGNARILARSSEIDENDWQAAGFYAVAYEIGDGVDGPRCPATKQCVSAMDILKSQRRSRIMHARPASTP